MSANENVARMERSEIWERRERFALLILPPPAKRWGRAVRARGRGIRELYRRDWALT